MNKIKGFSIVLLAAGQSSRLGKAKQLVKLQGESLLRRQCKLALEASEDVTVVLGADADIMVKELADLPVTTTINNSWALGMSSSIASGVKQVKQRASACLLLLVDQWMLTENDINQLVNAWRNSPDNIWHCTDNSKTMTGPPVIFPSCYFPELEQITGEQGAKVVIQNNLAQVENIVITNAFTDLDTPEQLAYCLKKIAAMNPK